MQSNNTQHPADFSHDRVAKEFETIKAMLAIYCKAHHHGARGDEFCTDCRDLLHYAHTRLLRCPFQEDKPTCGNCPIHCYNRDMRRRVQQVMRFSGPRMLYKHPLMALHHLLDGRRKAPPLNRKGRKSS
ncbi:MAG: nitrous oxide-stimulated promoter family protein [Desulfopila sp.]